MANQKLLDLIVEAMKDERPDRKKYDLMMGMSKSALVGKKIRFVYVYSILK